MPRRLARRHRTRDAVGLCAVLLWAPACGDGGGRSLADGGDAASDSGRDTGTSPADAGPDAGSDAGMAGTDAGTSSTSATVPERPAAPDDGEDVGERIYLLRDIVLDQGGERWRRIGYDLDGHATEPPDWPAECVPPSPTASPPVDGEGGIDNQFGEWLFATLEPTAPGWQAEAVDAQAAGRGAWLVRLRGWSGEPDDARVEVMVSSTVVGADGNVADGSPPPVSFPDPAVAPPDWDGHDWFWVRSDQFTDDDLERPRIADDDAYVSDGLIVARLPEGAELVLPTEDGGVPMHLTRSVLTLPAAAGEARPATLAGRWAVDDVMATGEALGVCAASAEHDILETSLDRTAGLLHHPGAGAPDVQCTAVGVGLELSAYAGRIAGVAAAPPLVGACD